jgi:hypothetical protein
MAVADIRWPMDGQRQRYMCHSRCRASKQSQPQLVRAEVVVPESDQAVLMQGRGHPRVRPHLPPRGVLVESAASTAWCCEPAPRQLAAAGKPRGRPPVRWRAERVLRSALTWRVLAVRPQGATPGPADRGLPARTEPC